MTVEASSITVDRLDSLLLSLGDASNDLKRLSEIKQVAEVAFFHFEQLEPDLQCRVYRLQELLLKRKEEIQSASASPSKKILEELLASVERSRIVIFDNGDQKAFLEESDWLVVGVKSAVVDRSQTPLLEGNIEKIEGWFMNPEVSEKREKEKEAEKEKEELHPFDKIAMQLLQLLLRDLGGSQEGSLILELVNVSLPPLFRQYSSRPTERREVKRVVEICDNLSFTLARLGDFMDDYRACLGVAKIRGGRLGYRTADAKEKLLYEAWSRRLADRHYLHGVSGELAIKRREKEILGTVLAKAFLGKSEGLTPAELALKNLFSVLGSMVVESVVKREACASFIDRFLELLPSWLQKIEGEGKKEEEEEIFSSLESVEHSGFQTLFQKISRLTENSWLVTKTFDLAMWVVAKIEPLIWLEIYKKLENPKGPLHLSRLLTSFRDLLWMDDQEGHFIPINRRRDLRCDEKSMSERYDRLIELIYPYFFTGSGWLKGSVAKTLKCCLELTQYPSILKLMLFQYILLPHLRGGSDLE